MTGFTLEQAQRLNDGILRSGKSKAAIARHVDIHPSVLTNITGTKALSGDEGTRPMMGAATFLKVCRLINLDPFYAMDMSDRRQGITESIIADLPRIAELLSAELIETATRRYACIGAQPSCDDITQWWRDCFGRIDLSSPFAQWVDIVHMPKPGDKFVRPRSIGGKSLSARKTNSTDPNHLLGIIELWPPEENQKVVNGYLEMRKVKSGPSFTGTDMSAEVAGEIVDFCAWRFPVEIPDAGKDLAMCFAHEWRKPANSATKLTRAG